MWISAEPVRLTVLKLLAAKTRSVRMIDPRVTDTSTRAVVCEAVVCEDDSRVTDASTWVLVCEDVVGEDDTYT